MSSKAFLLLSSKAFLLLSSDLFGLCFSLLLDRLARLLFVTAVLVLEAEGVDETGGSFNSDSDFDPASELGLPSTVAGLRRRIVAADSGPESELIGAGKRFCQIKSRCSNRTFCIVVK
jgi:hypothetical protein